MFTPFWVRQRIHFRRFRRGFFKIVKINCCFIVIATLFLIFSAETDTFSDQVSFLPAFMANYDSPGKSIICLGDSLTFGVGASQGHDYPALISKALGVNILNAGVDGDETGDALARLETDVLSKNPKLVIILLGANDYLNHKPLEKTFENLDQIIGRIQAQGAMAVLVEIGPGILGGSLQKKYNGIVLKRRAAFVDLNYKDIFFNPSLKSDTKHPNDKGYEIMAERILRAVKPLLKRPK